MKHIIYIYTLLLLICGILVTVREAWIFYHYHTARFAMRRIS